VALDEVKKQKKRKNQEANARAGIKALAEMSTVPGVQNKALGSSGGCVIAVDNGEDEEARRAKKRDTRASRRRQ
jgi:hypothetical protein